MNQTTEPDDESNERTLDLPPRETWSAAAVKLLKGVVYHDDAPKTFSEILAGLSPLQDYFGRLGLLLIVDEEYGMAFLQQPSGDQWPQEYESMPKLFRNVPLSYDATLLCVLLRDELRRCDEDMQNERCVVTQSDLLTTWQTFFPDEKDAVRNNRALGSSLAKLEELKFIKRFEKDPPSWEVKPLLRARMPMEKLRSIKSALVAELEKSGKKVESKVKTKVKAKAKLKVEASVEPTQ